MAVNNSPGDQTTVPTDPVTGGGNVSGSGSGATNPAQVPSGDPAALAFNSSTEVIGSEQSSLESFIVQVAGSSKSRVPHSYDDIVKAMGAVLKVTAVRPVYAAITPPATLSSLVDRIETGEAMVTALEGLLASMKGTNLASLKAGYAMVRSAYNHAKQDDEADQVVQNLMTPVEALFAKQPRATVAGVKAGTSTVKKAKAQARSTKASATATEAQQQLDDVVQSIVGSTAPEASTRATPPATTATPPATR